MIAAGGISALTMNHCHCLAQANAEATFVRHGPLGTAAGYSADPSDETELAVAVIIKGNCRAASSINFDGGAEAGRALSRLASRPKKATLR